MELGHVLVLSKAVRSSLMPERGGSMTSRWPEMYRLRVVASCLPWQHRQGFCSRAARGRGPGACPWIREGALQAQSHGPFADAARPPAAARPSQRLATCKQHLLQPVCFQGRNRPWTCRRPSTSSRTSSDTTLSRRTDAQRAESVWKQVAVI